jgi:hypothetical protein
MHSSKCGSTSKSMLCFISQCKQHIATFISCN